MNERIKELYEQAGLVGANGHFEYDFFDPEKFAELIVKECVKLNQQELSFTAYARMMEIYSEHFGIKE